MDPEFLDQQIRTRRGLERIAQEMATMARECLVALSNQPPDVNAAQGWFERIDIVSRLVQSIPIAGSEEHVERFPWRLERRTDL